MKIERQEVQGEGRGRLQARETGRVPGRRLGQDAHQEAGSSDTLESLGQPVQAAHRSSVPG